LCGFCSHSPEGDGGYHGVCGDTGSGLSTWWECDLCVLEFGELLRIALLESQHNSLSTLLLVNHPPLLAGKFCIVLSSSGKYLDKMILRAGEGRGSGCQKDHPAPVGLCHRPQIWALVADVTASVIERDNGASGELRDCGASAERLVELVDKTR